MHSQIELLKIQCLQEIDELCEEWIPEPLIPPITEEMQCEPPVLERWKYFAFPYRLFCLILLEIVHMLPCDSANLPFSLFFLLLLLLLRETILVATNLCLYDCPVTTLYPFFISFKEAFVWRDIAAPECVKSEVSSWMILCILKISRFIYLCSASGPHTVINGKEVVNFSSSNYLGLIAHEKLLVREFIPKSLLFLYFRKMGFLKSITSFIAGVLHLRIGKIWCWFMWSSWILWNYW